MGEGSLVTREKGRVKVGVVWRPLAGDDKAGTPPQDLHAAEEKPIGWDIGCIGYLLLRVYVASMSPTAAGIDVQETHLVGEMYPEAGGVLQRARPGVAIE